MKPTPSILAVFLVSLLLPLGVQSQESQKSNSPSPEIVTNTYTNPIVRSGADPWIVRKNDTYYYCFSRRNRIWVSQSKHLEEIGEGEKVSVWSPPANAHYSKELWAPELHYLQGKWYIYVAADDGDNFNHRMYVLEGTSQNPLDPFTFKGKIAAPTDRWAIDGTVLETSDGKLYFIWSGWDGFENVQQNLYIAPMSDPRTISGERVCISKPEYDWEKIGNPLINEGPQILKNGDTIFIIYSASGSWTDDYCLGQITLVGKDLLNPASWKKKSIPVFTRTENVYGPGHASFVKSEDGKEDWIVYHAAKHSGAGWNRHVCIKKFSWNEDGSPCFGSPVPQGMPKPIPAKK